MSGHSIQNNSVHWSRVDTGKTRELKFSNLMAIALVVPNYRFLSNLTYPKSDMVLLAGDLFHDNKPTRRTLHKTMEVFKRYTMGPNPVKIQILSQNNFAHGEANYLQEFYSVGECCDVHAGPWFRNRAAQYVRFRDGTVLTVCYLLRPTHLRHSRQS